MRLNLAEENVGFTLFGVCCGVCSTSSAAVREITLCYFVTILDTEMCWRNSVTSICQHLYCKCELLLLCGA